MLTTVNSYAAVEVRFTTWSLSLFTIHPCCTNQTAVTTGINEWNAVSEESLLLIAVVVNMYVLSHVRHSSAAAPPELIAVITAAACMD